jgi:hypothetical protein
MSLQTITEIKDAILSLPEKQRTSLRDWLIEIDKKIWDSEIELDFSDSGKGKKNLEKLEKDFEKGLCFNML